MLPPAREAMSAAVGPDSAAEQEQQEQQHLQHGKKKSGYGAILNATAAAAAVTAKGRVNVSSFMYICRYATRCEWVAGGE